MDRRSFLRSTGVATGVALLAPGRWPGRASAAVEGAGPYGALRTPDANGIRLPAGFRSRVIATTGQPVAGTGYTWHPLPDGGQCFPLDDGGWVLLSNSEAGESTGAVSAIEFAPDGTIRDAYAVLTGGRRNCSGAPTPQWTYLSCEEVPDGKVWECDPFQPGQGVKRPLLGSFAHEAAAVDPATGDVYMTEDDAVGRLYRFRPTTPGDLTAGRLSAASVNGSPDGGPDGATVSWVRVSTTRPDRQAVTTPFGGGEGMYLGDGAVYFTTKLDKRIWELRLRDQRLRVFHDASNAPPSSLDAVDAVVVDRRSGDLYVAEDGGNMQIGVIGRVGTQRQVAAFSQLEGHAGSEITGLAFSPDGSRLYFASQRGADGVHGVVYEVSGPFRTMPVAWPVDRDTFVRGGAFADRSFGDLRSVVVQTAATERDTRIGLLSVPTAAAEAIVDTAVLRLTARAVSAGAREVVVHAVGARWTESVTWRDRPRVGRELARFTVTSTDWRRHDVDISEHVRAERAAGRDRIAVALVQSHSGPAVEVASRQATGGRPVLRLTPLLFPARQPG